ncbi:hypothetical protein KTO58_10325 [Chitinophaga pendula]|nr:MULTISPECIES: hypothetical protein [Chitinophaga]UCJ09559.1 hypothetical protein KTO58_10325 [Chitinophaga pendula]
MKKQRSSRLALKKVCIAHLTKTAQVSQPKHRETFFELCTLDIPPVLKP